MNAEEGGSSAWLFSFVDLAFLMLIAMTQVSGNVGGVDAPDLAEMIVPSIGENGAPGELASGASQAWQLRIHPRSRPDDNPFELIAPEASSADLDARASPRQASGAEPSSRVAKSALMLELEELERVGASKPLLIPHEDSRSQDLLDAVSLLEERWPSRRRALVSRIAGR